MPSGPHVAVVGSVNMDLSVATPRVPLRGENLRAHRLSVVLGGKGACPSVALARLGAAAALVACVGADEFGRRALDTLAREGVDTAAIQALPDADTGVALILVDDAGENTILVIIGANERLVAAQVTAGLDALAAPPDRLLVNFEIPADAVRAALDWGRAHGVPVVVDAGPIRDYGPDVWAGADVLSPNAAEAEHLSGIAPSDDVRALAAARRLRADGPRAVALKLGDRGCLLLDEAGARIWPAFVVTAVDTTGAGDAWSAGLTLGLAQGRSLDEAALLANACGAVAVSRAGAVPSMPSAEDIAALYHHQPAPEPRWLA